MVLSATKQRLVKHYIVSRHQPNTSHRFREVTPYPAEFGNAFRRFRQVNVSHDNTRGSAGENSNIAEGAFRRTFITLAGVGPSFIENASSGAGLVLRLTLMY